MEKIQSLLKNGKIYLLNLLKVSKRYRLIQLRYITEIFKEWNLFISLPQRDFLSHLNYLYQHLVLNFTMKNENLVLTVRSITNNAEKPTA